jgi:2-keto-4-pentenoate hydratase/2-oxohepta-3-ene-1,7-dioic acid hydratase in catechol pathway
VGGISIVFRQSTTLAAADAAQQQRPIVAAVADSHGNWRNARRAAVVTGARPWGYPAMKIARFTTGASTRLGLVDGDGIIDAGHIADDLIPLLEGGEAAMARLRSLATDIGATRLPLSQVRLESPIRRPPKYLAIALNYAEHISETQLAKPDFPKFFNKQSTCIVGPHDAIHMPRVSNKLDYEGELGVVIGRRCRHVGRDRAAEVVAGYLVCNDVTVRDWQARSETFTLGKSFDTHGPIGPWVVTPDEVGDPHNLEFRTLVDGEERQHSNTRHMLFSIWEQIEVLSTAFTLEVGDIIATGTCAGVGVKMTPRGYLKVGQCCRVEIERIGAIENVVIEEPADTARM